MIKPSHATLYALIGAFIATSAFAASYQGDVHSVAERELARRQERVSQARIEISNGDAAMAQRDYETAVDQFKRACSLVPDSQETGVLRNKALNGFCDASCKLAEQRIAEGRYADAEVIVKLVISEDYDPHCKRAIALIAHLEDPDYYNKTIGPKFRGNVETVKKLFTEADGFYASGRYDLAYKRYEQILNLDPYNTAARKGQEKVNQARDNYAVQAYDTTRSYMNWQVDKAWERPVKKYGLEGGKAYETGAVPSANNVALLNKLNRITIPKINFQDATVREAIDFLKQKSKEMDTTEADPAKRGVNIVLKLESAPGSAAPAGAAPAIPGLETAPAEGAAAAPGAPSTPSVNPSDARITLSLSNIPLMEALKYITNLANLKIKVDPYAVAVVPYSENTETLITKEYKVPPSFIPSTPAGDAGGGLAGGATRAGAGGGGGDTTKGGMGIAKRQLAKEYLESQGIQFPPGAAANYLSSSSKLVVRNTQSNLDLIDTLVDSTSTVPTQVEIESKFVEITQNNLKELSFDWLLGAFNAPGSGKVFMAGGTPGTSPAVDAANFPLPYATTGALAQTPVTSGNRSGNLAISANAIDALLFPTAGASRLAPAVFGVAGILTDPTFSMVIRALDQKKGVDLLSAPRVTTKSGQRAVIEVIREFRYPTEFDPPQIPQNFGSLGGGTLAGGQITGGASGAFPVTPTTPTAFETRNTGVTLEVEPVIGPDGYTIDLNLVPQVVEFEGFINYGSPIKTISPLVAGLGGGINAALGASPSVTLTDNVINQPIFSTRKVTDQREHLGRPDRRPWRPDARGRAEGAGQSAGHW